MSGFGWPILLEQGEFQREGMVLCSSPSFQARDAPQQSLGCVPPRIPGEYRCLAIPVPIPNTVVKQVPPMILQ